MISIQKRFLFIHVPKTGGNSIQNILQGYSEDEIVTDKPDQDGVERFGVASRTYGTSKHSTLSQYKKVLPADVFRGLFKFATIRNPWDRMISCYFSPHRGRETFDRAAFAKMVKGERPLRDYVRARTPVAALAARLGLRLGGNGPLDREVDFLMRFERLEEDFAAVCERLSIPSTPLPRRNRSRRESYQRYYDAESRGLVERKFRDEIEHGGYEFERGN